MSLDPMSHIVRTSSFFERRYKKITKGNKQLKKRIRKVVELLSKNPFSSSLNTHKVNAKNFTGEYYSSTVTGDIRLIWKFEDNVIILIVNIGGYSGKNKVYK